MKNSTLKLLMMACIIFMAGYSNAQFKFGDKTSIGQTVVADSLTGVTTLMIDFNTDKGNSTWMEDSTGISVSFSKCQTNKGITQAVYVSEAADAGTVFNGDFKVRNWGSYENAVRMASIDSMAAIFAKYEEKYAGTGDSTKNVIWKPSACLFDIAEDDQAFGTHPGMYKRVEYGFQFKFEGNPVLSDIQFEMDTYDAGNTGETASYKLIVAVGSEDNIVGEVADFYVTGSAKKMVKVAESVGIDYTDFNNQKVYIWLKTMGTGTAMAEDSFDPTIVFDNFAVNYQMPVWINPAAGAVANMILDNEDDPLVAPADVATLDSMLIQINKRTGSLVIEDDLGDRKMKPVLNLAFMDTLGLMANDGSGNYTVPVDYSYNAPVWDANKLEWSKSKISVSSPDSMVNDDMMFYFYATPTSSNSHSVRFEMNCGTRIWYDYYMEGTAPSLDALTASAGVFSPAFDADKTEYQLTVPAGTASVSFTANSSDSTAVIVVPPALSLTDGEDVVASVTCSTSEGSATKEYTINVHVQNNNEILYIARSEAWSDLQPYDVRPIEMLREAGYSVTIKGNDEIKDSLNYDYSPYIAMVVGPGVSSSNVNDFAYAGYPIPCVTMQTDAPRSNKWGWIGTSGDDNQEMNQVKTSSTMSLDSLKMKISNVDNFITADYQLDELVEWQFGAADSADWLGKTIKSYNLVDSIPTAIALGSVRMDGTQLTSWWAVPEGSVVRTLTADNSYSSVTLSNRIVLLTLSPDLMMYIADGFESMIVKSVEWATEGETDASLMSITPSEGMLAPEFSSDKMSYQLNLPMGTTSVGLTATAKSPSAVVTLPADIVLTDGANEMMEVMVTAADDTTTATYTVYIHVQSEDELLYIARFESYGELLGYDKNPIDMLNEAGYSVTIKGNNEILDSVNYDYSDYNAMVVGPGVSSSNVNDFAYAGYPIPCVTMQTDGPKANKWGWIGVTGDDNKEMNQVKTSSSMSLDSLKMKISNVDNFITSDYQLDELVEWQNGTADSADWSGKTIKSYNLIDSIPTAIALGSLRMDGTQLSSWWAVPEGSIVRTRAADNSYSPVTLSSRIVVLTLSSELMNYATDGLAPMITKSVAWVMQAEADASLATLVPSTGELAPSFDAEKTEYQLNLPMGTTAVSLSATANSTYATVEIPGELALIDGMTETMTVTVTSSDETDTMMYKVMVHVQAEEEILFVSNSNGAYGDAGADVTNVYDALVAADYSVTLLNKLALNDTGFVYTPYAGLVIGGGVGSSWVNNFAIDGYPIPCVTMQHDGPRKGKWGWVGTDKDDNKQMNVVKTSESTPVDSAKMQITDNNHYITEGFELGELVEWQNGDGFSEDWTGSEVKSYNLADSIPSAIALGRIAIDGSALTSWWAIPRGSQVNTKGADGTYSKVALENRIVVLTVFNQGLLYAAEGFDTMVVRSLDWVLGAGGTVGVTRTEVASNVLVYPNPAKSFAKVRFTLTETADVSLSLYNMMGQKIEISNKERFSVGTNEIEVNTQNFKEGMYIYVLETGSKVAKGKLNIMK